MFFLKFQRLFTFNPGNPPEEYQKNTVKNELKNFRKVLKNMLKINLKSYQKY